MPQAGNGVSRTVRREADAYRRDEDRPLGGYVVVMAVFAALVAGAAGLAAATGRRLPAGFGPWDLLLLTAGTHKLSRTITKDSVTSPLRAPFTRYAELRPGAAELNEEVRDEGKHHQARHRRADHLPVLPRRLGGHRAHRRTGAGAPADPDGGDRADRANGGVGLPATGVLDGEGSRGGLSAPVSAGADRSPPRQAPTRPRRPPLPRSSSTHGGCRRTVAA